MAKKTFPSDKQEQFMLRLPDGMRSRIKIAAEANGRSMNAEIVAALEDKFPKDYHLDEIIRALTRLKLALYDPEPDYEAMREWIEYAQLDLEAVQRQFVRGDRGGML